MIYFTVPKQQINVATDCQLHSVQEDTLTFKTMDKSILGKVFRIDYVEGYKCFNPDMTCRNFQYKEGETYEHEGNVSPCRSGFHFCQKAEHCYEYYNENSIVHKVRGYNVKFHNDKAVCGQITILEQYHPDNKGIGNIGKGNQGHNNKGKGNIGNHNEGNHNKGKDNIGHHNIGNGNKGKDNIGHHNIGNHNIANHAIGYGNKSDHAVGVCNTKHTPFYAYNCLVTTDHTPLQVYQMSIAVLIKQPWYDEAKANS